MFSNLVLTVAESQLGIREVPGHDSDKMILSYHQATNLAAVSDEVPWCAAFVNWCFIMAALASCSSVLEWDNLVQELPPKQKLKLIETILGLPRSMRSHWLIKGKKVLSIAEPSYSAAAKSFLAVGYPIDLKTDSPVRGDLVVLNRGKNPAQGHVGFYYGGESLTDKTIRVLGGNQANAVTVGVFKASEVVSYRRF